MGQFLSVDFKSSILPDPAGRNLTEYLSSLSSVEEASYENKPSLVYFAVQVSETDRRKIPKYMFQGVSNCMAMGILYFEGRKAGWEEGLLLKFFHVLRVDLTSVSPEDNMYINFLNAPGVLVASSGGEVVEFLTGKQAVESNALLEALMKGLKKSGIDGEEILRRGVRDIPRIQSLEDRRYEIEETIGEIKAQLKEDRSSQSEGVARTKLQMDMDAYLAKLTMLREDLRKAYEQVLEVPLLYKM